MPELELHHDAAHHSDAAGQKVGVLAAAIAVCLAIVTIASHRTHTHAIVARTESNDLWSYYQSKRIKYHNLELGEDIIAALPPGASTPKLLDRYHAEKERYNREAQEVQAEARAKEAESMHAEERALRFDWGEGLLEIGLVLTSLFFIARKNMFLVIGAVAAAAGLGLGLWGFLI